MKHNVFLTTACLSCLIGLLIIANVNALSQSEASTSETWSAFNYYQGDSGTVTIRFVSSCPEELKLTYVGIHFDWMAENNYYRINLEANPASIPSNGAHTFNAIGFSIPTDASVGYHSYLILIKGQQHGLWWYDISWTSDSKMFRVKDAYEKVYNEQQPQTYTKVRNGQMANYQSPDAISLIQQSTDEYNLALSLADQGKWLDAVNHLSSASSLADQAVAKEKVYQQQLEERRQQEEEKREEQERKEQEEKEQQQKEQELQEDIKQQQTQFYNTITIAVVILVVIAVVGVVLGLKFVRGKKHNTST